MHKYVYTSNTTYTNNIIYTPVVNMHIAIGADTSKYILRSCALHDDIPTCLVTKNGATCQGNVGMSCGPQMIAVG